jgi:hypothetical protein
MISIGRGQSIFTRREQVVEAATGKLQKSILDLLLCCDCAVTLNVTYPNSPFSQSSTNEKAAMAVHRILFGAHQCDLVFPSSLSDLTSNPLILLSW